VDIVAGPMRMTNASNIIFSLISAVAVFALIVWVSVRFERRERDRRSNSAEGTHRSDKLWGHRLLIDVITVVCIGLLFSLCTFLVLTW